MLVLSTQPLSPSLWFNSPTLRCVPHSFKSHSFLSFSPFSLVSDISVYTVPSFLNCFSHSFLSYPLLNCFIHSFVSRPSFILSHPCLPIPSHPFLTVSPIPWPYSIHFLDVFLFPSCPLIPQLFLSSFLSLSFFTAHPFLPIPPIWNYCIHSFLSHPFFNYPFLFLFCTLPKMLTNPSSLTHSFIA